ncbi:MAG: DUF427 domain-containing protein [Balneolaceae bacterium]|nr:DUF427 domain-containing protein [Balneolaceae bacterium]
MDKIPKWAREARRRWKYDGSERPTFARKPDTGQESVWDYPRPPRIERDHREITVRYNELVIAKSVNALRFLETASAPTFYLPRTDVKMERLEQSDRVTRCEWKGYGTYWNIEVGEELLIDAAWSYEDPFPDFRVIAGMIAFYPTQLTCLVDGERVKPQPGGFYGGWVTGDIVGPMKGEQGSDSWW